MINGVFAPEGVFSPVQEVLDAILECEKQTRGASDWFEGVDVHHIFFEGQGCCPARILFRCLFCHRVGNDDFELPACR